MPIETSAVRLRVANIDQIVARDYSFDDGIKINLGLRMEVSGMHHNVFGGFTCLKLALSHGEAGSTEFRRMTYRGLE